MVCSKILSNLPAIRPLDRPTASRSIHDQVGVPLPAGAAHQVLLIEQTDNTSQFNRNPFRIWGWQRIRMKKSRATFELGWMTKATNCRTTQCPESKFLSIVTRVKHTNKANTMSLELTLEVAREFLKDNDAVGLSKFNSIADAAAEALAKHKGNLWLNGLKTLSDAAAEGLAKHKGNLDLSGLTTLSDAAAKALAKHEGDLWLHGVARAAVTRARKKLWQGK